MNRAQRAVLLAGGLLFAALGVYVPVCDSMDGPFNSRVTPTAVRYFAGYTWIFTYRFPDNNSGAKAEGIVWQLSYRHLDVPRIAVQWVALAGLVGSLYVALGRVGSERRGKPSDGDRAGDIRADPT